MAHVSSKMPDSRGKWVRNVALKYSLSSEPMIFIKHKNAGSLPLENNYYYITMYQKSKASNEIPSHVNLSLSFKVDKVEGFLDKINE